VNSIGLENSFADPAAFACSAGSSFALYFCTQDFKQPAKEYERIGICMRPLWDCRDALRASISRSRPSIALQTIEAVTVDAAWEWRSASMLDRDALAIALMAIQSTKVVEIPLEAERRLCRLGSRRHK
jgi:hypothetical protein